MAACPEVKAIYEETIKELTFRGSDGITIPKDVRENAYTLAVDIVIVSTAREEYKNYGVSPAEGFYGYATLVMQDMCEIKIPVKMPRQRLYYGRVPEAFIYWQTLVDWSYFQSYMTAIGESLVSLGTALGAGFVPSTNCCSLPDRSWIELPLREVYFNCKYGTQYKIEISWYKALQIEDGCGNIRDPRSKTEDGDKDTGLSPNGVQPNVAPDSGNPFANLPLPSSEAEQGNFSNSKISSLNNIPDPIGTIYWLEVIPINKEAGFIGGCSVTRTEKYYYEVPSASVSFTTSNRDIMDNGCGGRRVEVDLFLSTSPTTRFEVFRTTDGQITINKGQGLTIPTNSVVFV